MIVLSSVEGPEREPGLLDLSRRYRVLRIPDDRRDQNHHSNTRLNIS
jgi:hypothetical protein